MIEECNFKSFGTLCSLTSAGYLDAGMECVGEENCILYQIYKELKLK